MRGQDCKHITRAPVYITRACVFFICDLSADLWKTLRSLGMTGFWVGLVPLCTTGLLDNRAVIVHIGFIGKGAAVNR